MCALWSRCRVRLGSGVQYEVSLNNKAMSVLAVALLSLAAVGCSSGTTATRMSSMSEGRARTSGGQSTSTSTRTAVSSRRSCSWKGQVPSVQGASGNIVAGLVWQNTSAFSCVLPRVQELAAVTSNGSIPARCPTPCSPAQPQQLIAPDARIFTNVYGLRAEVCGHPGRPATTIVVKFTDRTTTSLALPRSLETACGVQYTRLAAA